MKTILFFFICLCAFSFADEKCPITQLTDDSARLLTTEDAPWLILFYLPTCPYYQEFEPQFLNITNNLCGEVSVGQIDVSEYKGFAEEINVQTVPTLVLLKDNQKYIYKGERNVNDVTYFAREGYKQDKPNISSVYIISTLLLVFIITLVL